MSIQGQTKPLALALMAMLLIGAGVAANAHATAEGPYYGIEGELLGSGETKEVTATVKSPFTFQTKPGQFRVECPLVKLKSGATLNGSSIKSAGTGHDTLEFSKCIGGAKEGLLTGCEPEGGKVTSTPLLDTVGFASSSKTGQVLVLMAPEAGTTLASVKFTGASCFTPSAALIGKAVAEAYAGASPVEVGKNEVQTTKNVLKLGNIGKTIWTESGGSLTSTVGGATFLGASTSIEGEAALELVGAQAWGPIPLPEQVGGYYTFTPSFLNFNSGATTKLGFTIENRSGETLELKSLKISGTESSKYALTDTHFCAVKTITTLGHCEVTIELVKNTTGSALFEGSLLFGGVALKPFATKALVN